MIDLSEFGIQYHFFQYIDKAHPDLPIFAIPNGGKGRTWSEGRDLKQTGTRPGVLDVFCAVARGGYHGLFIEFKAKLGTLSEKQKSWIDKLSAQDYLCVVLRDPNEAARYLEQYLNGLILKGE